MARITRDKIKFETALERLEEIIRKLESGNIDLDDSLKLYEEGIGLVRFANDKLKAAQQKVELLTKDREGRVTGSEELPAGPESEPGLETEEDNDGDDAEAPAGR